MAITNPGIFKRTNYKYTASSITINQPVSGSDIAFWDNPETTTYSSRYSQSDTALSSGIRGDSPVTEAMDIDWRPYKILTQRPGNINGYQYLATTTDLLMSLNANYVELKDAVSNAQTSANTISYSLSTTGKVVTLSGSNPSSSLTFGGDNWINIAGPANATLTGKLTFTHGTPNIANNTGTTKGGGTSEIITKITYDSKGHIADVVKGTLTTEKLETDGNGKVVKQVVLDGYKLKVAYTNTITNATNATNATNVDLSLTYDTSTGIKVQAGSGTAGTLKATLAQGSDHDKVILQLGGSKAGSEVTINDVAHATSADTATNLDAAPVLSAGTNNGNAIKVTVGGQTSAEFLVPYANRVSVHSTVGTNNAYFLLAGQGGGLNFGANATTPSKPTGLGKYAYLYRTGSNSSTYTYVHNLHTNVSVSYNNGLIVTVGDIQSDVVPFKLATSGSGSSAKIGLRIGGNTAGSDITVPYATTAGSADSATTAGSATNAANTEKVLINADQYDTLTPATVIDAVIKLAEQDDPAPMEQLRAANFGITPVVFAANEKKSSKSSKYIFESGANNSLWSNPLTSQESLTNNGPFILHNKNKPDILYSQVIGVNKIYGKEFTGNAATATSATTAAGFTGTVSLQNVSNQLKVTVGSTTSSGLTIAYATNAGNADTVDGYHIVNGTGTNANTIYIVT